MERDRNPSGLPSSRIVGPIYGPREIDLYQRVGNQPGGFVRVRNSLLVTSIVVGALAAVAAAFGNTPTASGILWIMLAPLLLVLGGTQLAVMITRPKRRDAPPEHP